MKAWLQDEAVIQRMNREDACLVVEKPMVIEWWFFLLFMRNRGNGSCYKKKSFQGQYMLPCPFCKKLIPGCGVTFIAP